MFDVADDTDESLFISRKNTQVDGPVCTFRLLLPLMLCAWSEERSIATSCFPRWMLISWVGAIMFRTTTVLNFALYGPQ